MVLNENKSLITVLHEAKKNGVNLLLEQGELKIRAKKGTKVSEQFLTYIKENKAEVLDFLKNRDQETAKTKNAPKIRKRLEKDLGQIPMSFAQEGLWFLDQLQEGSTQYHIPAVVRIGGILDKNILEDCFRILVKRHQSLRTVFKEVDGQGYQELLHWKNFTIATDRVGQIMLHEKIEEELAMPFDLNRDYMLRVKLLQVSSDEQILVVVMHHIAADGWSMPILVKELGALYNAKYTGQEIALSDLPVQYTDYSLWQREKLTGDVLEGRLQYWENHLKGVEELRLPLDKKRPATFTTSGKAFSFKLGSSISKQINELSKELECTPFMLLLSVYNILLYRYAGQSDICVGVPIANRGQEEITNLIGYFANTIALHSKVDATLRFSTFLSEIKKATLTGYEYQDVPFEKVVDRLVNERDQSQTPLVQTTFSLQNSTTTLPLNFGDLEAQLEPIAPKTSKFDLSMDVEVQLDDFKVSMVYRTDLFDDDTVIRMGTHFKTVLASVLENSEVLIENISLLSAQEQLSLLSDYSCGVLDGAFVSDGLTVLDLLWDVCSSSGSSICLSGGGTDLSYDALWERSDALSVHLRKVVGASKGDRIGVYMPRVPDLLVAVLGIWKAGCAYVPVDVSHPLERLSGILADSGSVAVLVDSGSDALSGIGVPVVEVPKVPLSDVGSLAPVALTGGDLSYVLYTSGTSGRPKGVLVSHGNLYAYLEGIMQLFPSAGVQAVLSSNGFDIFHFEVFRALLVGGRALLLDDGEVRDMDVLLGALKGSNSFHAVPALMSAITEAVLSVDGAGYEGITELYTGGDTVPRATLLGMREAFPGAAIHEFYGPTEGTVFVTVRSYSPEEELTGPVTIGRPMGHNRVYVLDRDGLPCPVGVVGELYIGGPQVTLGYLGLSGATSRHYVASRFDGGGRLYRSGDLAKWLPDGSLVFLGRNDRQLKVRGHRIEPGEVERALEGHSQVSRAVVSAPDLGGGPQLIAHVVGKGDQGLDQGGLARHLGGILPDYMVPRRYVVLERLPLTANGKVDHGALPLPAGSAAEDHRPPETATEKKLVQLWEAILERSPIGTTDNFFELGGDSIKAIQLMGRARSYEIHFKVKDVFKHQTIRTLSQNLKAATTTVSEEGILEGVSGLLPVQREFFETAHPDSGHYNQSVLLKVPKALSVSKLTKAVETLAAHHDALRFYYDFSNVGPTQNYGKLSPSLIIENPSATRSIELICSEYQQSLNLAEGVVCRFVYMPLKGESGRLLILAHHLCVDGVSWRVLLEDLNTLLKASEDNRTVLPPKRSSFRQWHARLVSHVAQLEEANEAHYWKGVLEKYSDFPTDFSVKGRTTYEEVNSIGHVLDKETTEELLKGTHHAYGTEINDVLLSAIGRSLTAWSGMKEVVLWLEGHGREELFEDIDIARTVGWFTTTYPVLLRSYTNVSEQLKETKDMLRDLPGRGIGYGLLRNYSKNDVPTLAKPSGGVVVFNYLGSFDNSLGEEAFLGYATESRGNEISPNNYTDAAIAINSMVIRGELRTEWNYDTKRYSAATIERLALDYQNELEGIIAHCQDQRRSKTRSDYGLPPTIANQELTAFLEKMPLVSNVYGLSPLQEGMLFHSLYKEGALAYVSRFSCDFPAGLNAELFRSVWSYLMECHGILRTSVHGNRFDIPVQCVHEKLPVPLREIDFGHLSGKELEKALDQHEAHEASQGFDLTKAPLFGFSLVQLPEGGTKLSMRNHHILWDGWSLSILMGQFIRCYDALAKGNPLPKIPNSDYARFIEHLGDSKRSASKNFWTSYLKGIEKPTYLPYIAQDQKRNKVFGNVHSRLRFDQELVGKLKQFAKDNHLTMNTVLQGAWAYLVSRYTGSSKVVFGATVSGRDWGGDSVAGEIGLYINSLPVRTNIESDRTIKEWLSELQETHTRCREDHAHVSLGDIQKWTNIGSPIFDSLLVFDNYPVDAAIADSPLTVKNITAELYSNYVLTMGVSHVGDSLAIKFDYNEEQLETATVRMIQEHLTTVLTAMVSKADTIRDLRYMKQDEGNRLLGVRAESNRTSTTVDQGASILERFEQQVEMTPDSTAITFEANSLSYRELNEMANRLARRLLTIAEVKTNDLVGILLPRSDRALVSILAVLKTGAAYLPIDPTYPQERINHVLHDSAAKLLITNTALSGLVDGEKIVCIDDLDCTDEASENLGKTLPLNALAYVIYTSGSTGLPKGVMVEHAALANYISWASKMYVTPGKVPCFPLFSSLSFDLTLTSIFTPLITGGRIVIYGNNHRISIEEVIKDNQVDTIKLTPSHLKIIKEYKAEAHAPSTIKKFIVGGEALKTELAKDIVQMFGPTVEIYNEYGPTEATVGCMIYKFPSGEDIEMTDVPIGKAISNMHVYVLDADLRPVPIGVEGGMYVSGIGVARGYLHNPELSNQRFVTAPWSPKERLYNTGDIGRWRSDKNLEFIGRSDEQVKIRGYRIELGEIVSNLEKSPLIKQAVVVVREDSRVDKKELIAYIVPNENYDKDIVKRALEVTLPEYMVPGHFVELKEIPLTVNGKVDRKKLPELEVDQEYDPAATPFEKRLVPIWAEVLGIPEGQVGINTSFFDMGGHSLTAISLINRIAKEFDATVSLDDIFNDSTICAIGKLIAKSKITDHGAILKAPQKEYYALSSAQKRMYFLYEFNRASIAYNMPYMVKLEGRLNRASMEKAFCALIDRHEILRTNFVLQGETPMQKVMKRIDFSLENYANRSNDIHALIEQFVRPFNLANGPLIRVGIVPMAKDEHLLMLDMHHIVTDGVSQGILLKDFMSLYQGKALAEPQLRYRDYSEWQQGKEHQKAIAEQRKFWLGQFQDLPIPLELPRDFARPLIKQDAGARIDFELDETVTRALKLLAEQEGTTLFMVLLAAYNVLLAKLSGQEDIVIGTPIAGREHADLEEMVGMFVNTLALRNYPKGELGFSSFLQELKKNAIACFKNQGLQYEELIEDLQLARDTARNPLFDAQFSFHNTEDVKAVIPGLDLIPFHSPTTVSKFDLTLLTREENGKLFMSLEYATSLFKKETIERFRAYFQRIINSVVSDKKLKINNIEVLSEAETDCLLNDFNATEKAYPKNHMIPSLFEKYARSKPESIALVFGNDTMTYGELDERSLALAAYLVGQGVKKGTMVPICLERSFEMVIGILGVLRAGGAYVPIDPEYPADRIDYILKDIDAKLLLSNTVHMGELLGHIVGDIALVNLDAELPSRDTLVRKLPLLQESDLMYVIYTSGTTGTPKGVMNEHGGVLNRLFWMQEYLAISHEDRILQKTTFCFDVSVWEFLLPLMSGAQMVIASPEGHKDAYYLQKLITTQEVSIIHFVPSMLTSFLPTIDADWESSLRHVVCSGEELKLETVQKFKSKFKGSRLHNLYGPTEAAIDVTAIDVTDHNGAQVPIGWPVANTRIYILDNYRNPVPIGVPGDLYIGGVQVARGYLNLENITVEKFIENPFVKDERLYQTGDIAKWAANGTIAYLGRKDTQVKIRGHRIELGEIENILMGHPAISASIVLLKKQAGDLFLAAFYVSDKAVETEKLRSHLSQRLPDYMIPTHFHHITSLPLTANGKIDREQLLTLQLEEVLDYVPPATDIEEKLVLIWAEILGLDKDRLSVTSDFFRLGGHSLKAMEFIVKVHKNFDMKFSLQEFFGRPTIQLVAEYIELNSWIKNQTHTGANKKTIIEI